VHAADTGHPLGLRGLTCGDVVTGQCESAVNWLFCKFGPARSQAGGPRGRRARAPPRAGAAFGPTPTGPSREPASPSGAQWR
jgi:hypothetical protein